MVTDNVHQQSGKQHRPSELQAILLRNHNCLSEKEENKEEKALVHCQGNARILQMLRSLAYQVAAHFLP